jgi:DNA-directed RNA polymerase specialized sigma24 family protein
LGAVDRLEKFGGQVGLEGLDAHAEKLLAQEVGELVPVEDQLRTATSERTLCAWTETQLWSNAIMNSSCSALARTASRVRSGSAARAVSRSRSNSRSWTSSAGSIASAASMRAERMALVASLGTNGDLDEFAGPAAEDTDPCELAIAHAEHQERVTRLRALSDRERLYLYLQGLGYRYSEMAKLTSASVRTVERQVLRARSKLGDPRRRG